MVAGHDAERSWAAVIAKLGGATTVSVSVVFCWMPPPLPVTVMG